MSMPKTEEQIFTYSPQNEDEVRAVIYNRLEEYFLTWRELSVIPSADNGENFVPISQFGIAYLNLDERMRAYSANDIYVRSSIVSLLQNADKALRSINNDWQLEVVYGYRHPNIQCASFEKVKSDLVAKTQGMSENEIKEAVHRMVAAPDVAGHPTGGAVDIRVKAFETDYIDMGTNMYDFSRDSYTFSPFISREAWHNRQILRNVMITCGFAPFDGEWWHFSFGDKEWAKYYGYKNAIYTQVEKVFV